jgi:hypothetical protein
MKYKPHTQKHTSPTATFPPAHWSPGKPFQTFEPDAHQALSRHADVWEAQSNVRQFPTRPRPTSPIGEKRRAA